MRGFGGGANAFGGVSDGVGRGVGRLRDVFDGAAGEARGCGKANGFRGAFRIVGVTIFQIGADGQIGGRGDGGGVSEHGVAAHGAVGLGDGESVSGAGGGQRFEAENFENAGRADVPGVGDEEGAVALVQRAEGGGFFWLRAHEGRHCTPGNGEKEFEGELGIWVEANAKGYDLRSKAAQEVGACAPTFMS